MATQGAKSAKWKTYLWPVIGIVAILVSFWFLAQELRGLSWTDLWAGIDAIKMPHWLAIVGCTLGCYAILAGYDWLALEHLRKKVNYLFVAGCSLTTYALAHTIGASAFTGAIIRYRAYSTKGLSGPEVGVLVTFCSLTFTLGVMVVLGLAFLLSPGLEDRFANMLSPHFVRWLAIMLLVGVGLYVAGSAAKLPELKIRNFSLSYPRLSVAIKQIVVAPTELLFAAGILYFALPEVGNPGYLVVMGVFVVSFSLALLSHAPGGLGVFELAVLTGLPEFSTETVIAALIVFRICYFLIPLAMGLVMVAWFEHGQLKARQADHKH